VILNRAQTPPLKLPLSVLGVALSSALSLLIGKLGLAILFSDLGRLQNKRGELARLIAG
jgi:hypothetical protein